MFRPRYSLLTLLLLTAGVAGGVKLWRGPHRVQITQLAGYEGAVAKNSPEVKQWLDQMPLRPDVCSSSHIDYQLEYIQHWDRKQILSVSGAFRVPHLLIGSSSNIYIWPGARSEVAASDESISSRKFEEQIVCFFFAEPIMLSSKLGHAGGTVWYNLPSGKDRPIEQELFFLTTRKQIYQLQLTGIFERTVKHVELDSIANPNIRTRIAEELASIPDPQ